MKDKQDKIRNIFLNGLRRVAKMLSEARLKVKSIAQEDALVFWYEPVGERKKRGAKG